MTASRMAGAVLLDASALMALMADEAGAAKVKAALLNQHCLISSVTLTEVEGKLVGRGEMTHGQVTEVLAQVLSAVDEVPFGAACRERAVFYYARKSPYNLSLGDAACLGTAEALSMDVLTAERGWQAIPDLPIKVELIR